jgi:hypothetical protein
MHPAQEVGGSDLKGAVGSYSRPQDYGPPSATWVPSDSPVLPRTQGDTASPYWRMNHQESPITPVFAPYSPSLQQQLPQSNWSHAPAEQGARDELGWGTAPQRSMSYSHPDTIRHSSTFPSFPHPGVQSSIREDFNHRLPNPVQGDLYSPSLTPGTNSVPGEASSTSTAEEHTPQHTHSSIPLPPPSFPAQSAQPWQPFPYAKAPLPTGNEAFTNWYQNPPATLSQQDGQVEAMAPAYPHPEPYGGIYGYPNVTQGAR